MNTDPEHIHRTRLRGTRAHAPWEPNYFHFGGGCAPQTGQFLRETQFSETMGEQNLKQWTRLIQTISYDSHLVGCQNVSIRSIDNKCILCSRIDLVLTGR